MTNYTDKIHCESIVKSYRYGNTLELTTSNGLHKQTIKVLPNKKYVLLETGEIFEMDTNNKLRSDNVKSVKQTMKKLRRLISHNFEGKQNELWITLTYREITTDPQIVYRDFKIFIKKLRKKYNFLEYINVIEPQASGSWHCHLLLKSTENKVLYIPNDIIETSWNKGFTKTKRLKSSDKVGNYVVSYLSNLDIKESSLNNEKKYVKGARLYLYPKGLRIYRSSRGINKPIEMTATKQEILQLNLVKESTIASFSKKTNHVLPSGEQISYITEFFNQIGGKDEDSES